jgi:hypothetical protein
MVILRMCLCMKWLCDVFACMYAAYICVCINIVCVRVYVLSDVRDIACVYAYLYERYVRYDNIDVGM